MKAEKYHLNAESGFTRFQFISEGRKGTIRKLIEFQKTNNPDVSIWLLEILMKKHKSLMI
jgi:hypothetical protein